MKLTHAVLAAALGSAMVVSLSACNSSNPNPRRSDGPSVSSEGSAARATSAPFGKWPGATTRARHLGTKTASMPPPAAAESRTTARDAPAGTNWFGGPIYMGKPNLAATEALAKAGGGADNFSFSKALVSMLGEKTVNAEVNKLNKHYGKNKVGSFMRGMTFVVKDALKRARAQGITMPPPAKLSGKALAEALVNAGTTPKGTFWAGYLFDRTVSHKIHDEVMADVDGKFSHAFDSTTHKILNQAMYDVAQTLGMKGVKLASFH